MRRCNLILFSTTPSQTPNFICMYFRTIKYILWLSSAHEDFEKLGTRVDKACYPLDPYTFLF